MGLFNIYFPQEDKNPCLFCSLNLQVLALKSSINTCGMSLHTSGDGEVTASRGSLVGVVHFSLLVFPIIEPTLFPWSFHLALALNSSADSWS